MGSFPSPFCYKDMVMGCCGKNGRATRRLRDKMAEVKEQVKAPKKVDEGFYRDRPEWIARKKKKYGEKKFNELYGNVEPEAPDLPKVG